MTSGFSKYDCAEIIQSSYCYPDSTVLVNKMGLKDQKQLTNLDSNVTALRITMLGQKPIRGLFDPVHLNKIHRFIFQDLYPFAGKIRQEDIWKGETFFCKSQYIEMNLDSLLSKLKQENFLKGLSCDQFIPRLAYYFSELNLIHPFREGNGRAIREFIRCLALQAGRAIDWSISQKELLEAMIAAANGDLEPLETCLRATFG
jgi:cell filamentation protein